MSHPVKPEPNKTMAIIALGNYTTYVQPDSPENRSSDAFSTNP